MKDVCAAVSNGILSPESDAMGLPDWRLPWVVNHHANHFTAFLIVFVLTEKILILWDRVIYSYLIQVS